MILSCYKTEAGTYAGYSNGVTNDVLTAETYYPQHQTRLKVYLEDGVWCVKDVTNLGALND